MKRLRRCRSWQRQDAGQFSDSGFEFGDGIRYQLFGLGEVIGVVEHFVAQPPQAVNPLVKKTTLVLVPWLYGVNVPAGAAGPCGGRSPP